jgi:protein TonB
MKGPGLAAVGNERAPRHFLRRAAGGSLLLHALVISQFTFLGSRVAKPAETPPAIEVELSFAPAAQPAAPAKLEATPTPQKPAPSEKLPTPLSTPNPSAETLAAPPVNEPPAEKSAAAPTPATGANADSPGHASTNTGDNRQPSVVFGPRPSYPPEARAGGREGKVRVKVLIAENGTPGEIQLAESSGSASLDEAALTTLRRWHFQPALRNGQPVLAWVTVPVIFSLR